VKEVAVDNIMAKKTREKERDNGMLLELGARVSIFDWTIGSRF